MRAIPITALATLLLALSLSRPAAAQSGATGVLEVLADNPEHLWSVVVSRRGVPVASCATPCRIELPAGRYAVRAQSELRTLVTRVDVGEPGRVVRLGARDSLRSLVGTALTLLGVGAGVIVADHAMYLATPMGASMQLFASRYVEGISPGVALATGAVLLPAAFALIVRGAMFTSESAERLVTSSERRRGRPAFARLSSVLVEPVSGGGMVRAWLSF